MRSTPWLLTEFPAANLDAGLDGDAVAHSLVRFGRNRLTPLPRIPLWKKFLEKFDEPIIKILLAAALLSVVVELFKTNQTLGAVALASVVTIIGTGLAVAKLRAWVPAVMFGLAILWVVAGAARGHPSYEGLAVMIAVVLATGVAFASEYKSDREFEVLNAHKDEILVKVTRRGAFVTIPLEQVVVGDLVTLETGDEIPADGRLVKATGLTIDQSLMTGESLPVRKVPLPNDEADGPDKPDCLYRGTQVIDGIGQVLITEVGDETMIGQIARKLSADGDADERDEASGPGGEGKRVQKKLTISKQLTPLQRKLADLADLISKVGYVAAVAIFLALMARGGFTGSFTHGAFDTIKYILDAFVYMVIVIVVAVPEGLPMSVTVSLALAMRKMTRANSLVRQLVACETIGSATVICSDKTGTLTQNKMQVDRLWWDGLMFDRGAPNWVAIDPKEEWPRPDKPEDWIALTAAVNSTANLEEKEAGKFVPVGNSTEGALLTWLHENGVEYQNLRLQFPPAYQVLFSSDRKHMTTVVLYGSRLTALIKGAPEVILEMSTHYLSAQGRIQPWNEAALNGLLAALKDSAAKAMRTLAFGYKLLPHDLADRAEASAAWQSDLEAGYVFAGFAAIRDPLREEVKDAVRHCRQAGIEVKMITGDNVETARAIAGDIGLLDTPQAAVLTHDEFEAMSDERLEEVMPRLRVLARARPMDKLRIVHILQSQNHVVAMTGDGSNDAPALKQADVGLAMGLAGTEVAKEASKIVLLDDSFATIVKAVTWGRSLYENIQRFIQFQLTINVSALAIAFLGPFVGVKPPFTVLQLLWINVIMDTFASIALCSEAPRHGIMLAPPKRKDESILTRQMLITIFSTAAFFVVAMLVLLIGMEKRDDDNPGWFAGGGPWSSEFPELTVRQVSIFFTAYVLFQVWNQINCRSLTPERSGLTGVLRNPVFMAVAGVTIVGQVLIVTIGGPVFKVEPLNALDWLVIGAGTASVLVFAEVARLIRKRSIPAPPV